MTANEHPTTQGGEQQTDLKHIIGLLPKLRKGRELTISYDKIAHWWYVGYPNLDGDYSIDLYTNDDDIEGACLHLLSLLDEEKL